MERIGRTGPFLALAVVAAVADLVGVAAFRSAAPYVGPVELARMAAPAIVLAAAAAVLAVSGHRRSAPLLLAVASFGAAAPALSVGLEQRWVGWVPAGALGGLVAPAVVWCALTFPDGRLSGRFARVVAGLALGLGLAGVVAVAVSYDPAAWGWCRCAGNPLHAGVGPDGYLRVADAVTLVHAAVAGLAFGALLLLRRWSLFAGVVLLLLVAWFLADVTDFPRWPAEVLLVLMPLLYVAGYAGRRPSRSHVADLLLAVREEYDLGRLRALVARALGDPRTVVAWWDPEAGEYRDHVGRPLGSLSPDALRIDAGGRPVALVVSDRLAWVGPGVRDSVAEALRLAAENRRLTEELQATLDQVRSSRARILAASDEARRRIERDLHDGAQQLLISTGIKLNLAASQATSGEQPLLDEAAGELHRALAELRRIAAGIAPAALVQEGLPGALEELALRAPVPTTVRLTGDARPAEFIASTAYFVVAECLTNVAKHARATWAAVEVELADPLRLRVIDDGRGGAVLDGDGTGLRGLVDRVDALGGSLSLTSGPSGTTVSVTLP